MILWGLDRLRRPIWNLPGSYKVQVFGESDMMNFQMRQFRQGKYNSAVTPVITIILGLFLILNPSGVGKGLAAIIGIVLIISGAFDLLHYLSLNQRGGLLSGIVKCLLGIYAVTRGARLLSLLSIIAGLFIILNAINLIRNSLNLRAAHAPGGTVSLVFSVLFLLVGISMLFNPFGAVAAVFQIIGIILLLNGIFGLAQWYGMNRMHF